MILPASRRTRLASLALCAGAAACAPAPTPSRPDLVVVVADTLRRDRLGVYGCERGLTPALDALARESIVFERALAPASWTKPSIATLFTGLMPSRHRVLGSPTQRPALSVLDADITTLAEGLRARGYRTAGFVTNPHLAPAFGFDAGFDTYVEPAGSADEAVRLALDWVAAQDERAPLFLYVHVLEPHAPYQPPQDLRERFVESGPGERAPFTTVGHPMEVAAWSRAFKRHSADQGERPFAIDVTRLRPDLLDDETLALLRTADATISRENLLERTHLGFRGPDDPELLQRAAHLRSLYDAEVAAVDRAVGRLIESLRSGGRLERGALVITSDHGEAFLEHGEWGHGTSVHAEEVDVPLLLRLPTGMGTPRRVGTTAVGLADLAPTLWELAGARVPAGLDGASLLPILRAGPGSEPDRRVVLSEALARDRDLVAAASASRKLVLELDQGVPVRVTAYDTRGDPTEQVPLDASTPAADDAELRRLRGRALALIETRPATESEVAEQAEVPASTLRALRALGYR